MSNVGLHAALFCGRYQPGIVGAPRLSRSDAALHHHHQWEAAGGGEARLLPWRHGPAPRCYVRKAGRREASRTINQALARRERLSSKRQ